MSFAEPPSQPPPPRPGRAGPPRMPAPRPRRVSPLALTVTVLLALAVILSLTAQIWTEYAWFQQLDKLVVWRTRLLWQLALFVVGGLVMAVAVAASMVLAYRKRPVYAPSLDELGASLERYRASVDPLRRLFVIGLPVALGLFAGSATAQQWSTWLLFLNGENFGTKDPEFGYDIGFYVFKLPFLQFVVGYLLAVLALALIAAVVTSYVYGGIKLSGPGPRSTPFARRQLGITAAALLMVQGAAYWLDRYGVLSQRSQGDLMTGGSYTSVHAVLPAQAILAILAVLVALTFLSPIFTGTWRLAAMSVALMLIASIAIGGAYPALVQQLQVRPSQLTREAPYIERNIAATRTAYGLDKVQVTGYKPKTDGEAQALKNDATTTASLRLLDPAIVSPAFVQLQRQRGYYTFPDALDVDRYEIDGTVRDTVIAARELNLDGLGTRRNWVNSHIVYTHGFGVVAAYGNQRTPEGEPAFYERNIPSTGELGKYEERIYFGEETKQFSIVGAPKGSPPREIDYPEEGENSSVHRTTFAGDGGPSVGNLFARTMFALKFRDQNILLSGDINSESQILYDRTPIQRLEKVAPFLTVDGDPYPAVVNGRVVWILDGFTTSDKYPYSEKQTLSESTRDTLTETTQIQAAQGEVNYIRNSVKATVDAYDGKVTLYGWDEKDPVLKAWTKSFPGLVKAQSTLNSDLMSHLRYPEDLFKVQRDLLGRYHVTDPGEFFSNQDAWSTPQDPTQNDVNAKQPPYYLTLQMPNQETPAFSLTSSYIPRSAANTKTSALTGFLAVNADAGREAGKPSKDYGTLRLLRLPESAGVAGPGQVQANFNSETQIQSGLNLLRTGGSSEVKLGNLLTVPVGGGLLYVQPVYVQAKQGTSIPLLRKVLVLFGNKVGFADTLDDALNQVFGGDSGATAGDADNATGGGGEAAPGTQTPQQRLQAALKSAQEALTAGQEALKKGDFAAYGTAQGRLQRAIEEATAAEEAVAAAATAPAGGGATPTPSPSATP